MYFIRICFLIFFSHIPSVWVSGQDPPTEKDTLKTYSYNDLILKMGNTKDSYLRNLYCGALLKKAKIENDTTNIIFAYDLLAFFNDNERSIVYLDSIIYITKINKDTFYLTDALLQKGTKYFHMRKFKKALDNYILANNYSLKLNKPKLRYSSQHGIGVLKLRIGDYEDALKIHEENLSYFKNPSSDFTHENHLNTIFSLASGNKKIGNLDLSTKYNKLGIQLALEGENDEMYNLFVLNEGTVHFLRNSINMSFDSIQKALPFFEERNLKPDLAFAYYYLGKIYFNKNKDSIAVDYLKKVDTIIQSTNDINPELETTYKLLSDYYKKVGDKENQLLYLNKLIIADSVLNSYQSYVGKNITEKFDIPRLISERNQIIISLENRTSNLYYSIAFALLTILGGYIIFSHRQRKLKKRFENLIKTTKIEKEVVITEKSSKKETANVPLPIANSILVGLEKFEKNHEFKNSNLTLSTLAKSLNTNSNYLSKIINSTKGENFSTYVNDLRLEFALVELKNSQLFRNFKISAIANDVGFNNAETFSRLFKKKNGIYPSYFIQQLNKKKK